MSQFFKTMVNFGAASTSKLLASATRRQDNAKKMGRGRSEDISDNQSLESCDLTDSDDLSEMDSRSELERDSSLLPEEECYIPTFLHSKNCDSKLIEETRDQLKLRYAKNPGNFYEHDYERMLVDDWAVSRFLLRRRLQPKRAARLIEECGRFRKLHKMSEVKLNQFPIEFHQVGGLFRYRTDRVGNETVYMRTKMYRRVPDLSEVFKAFILCVMEEADRANEGRGVAIIFDLTDCGLQNVDLSFLSWLLKSFRNYCPKGVSYIMVYNLPWFLNATCKLACSWLSPNNKKALRFVKDNEIQEFISPDHLPDYLGGTCEQDYRAIPEGSKPAIELCDQLNMSPEQALKIRQLFNEYLPPEDTQPTAGSGETIENERHVSRTENDDQIQEEEATISHSILTPKIDGSKVKESLDHNENETMIS